MGSAPFPAWFPENHFLCLSAGVKAGSVKGGGNKMTEGSRLRETVILFSESEAALDRLSKSNLTAGGMILVFEDHSPCLPARAGDWGQRPHGKRSCERSERRRGHGEAVGRSDRRERRVGNKKRMRLTPHPFCFGKRSAQRRRRGGVRDAQWRRSCPEGMERSGTRSGPARRATRKLSTGRKSRLNI